MAKKDKLKGMFEPAIGDNKSEPVKEKKVTPMGVSLEQAELDRLDLIAKELGQKRHAVMQYAVRDFIKRYDQGERPKTKTQTITILDAE